MTHFPLAAAALLLAAPLFAQGPPVDTSFLKRYAETRGFMLGRPSKPKFTPDGKAVLFLRAAGPATPRQALFEFDIATGKTRELLSAETLLHGATEQVSPEEKARRERQRVSVGGFADYHLDEAGGRVVVMLAGKVYVVERAAGKVRELKCGPGTIVDPKWSPDGKYVSYVRDYDVMAYDLAADNEQAVTSGGTAIKTHGLAEFVAQEEMDRHTGYWWSPDGKYIAYEEADHTGVEVWHIADPLRPDKPPQAQYYPRPGKKNVSVRLGVVPVAGGPTVWVEWDWRRYEYLGRVAWTRDRIALTLQSRGQHILEYTLADPTSGVVQPGLKLAVDRSLHGWLDLPPDMIRLKKVGGVLYQFPADTPRRTRICFFTAPDGRPDSHMTDGLADEVLAVDEEGLRFFVTGPTDPTQRHVFRLTYERGVGFPDDENGGEQLTQAPGVHTATFAPDGSAGVFTSTTLDGLPASVVRKAAPNGGSLGTLPSVAADPPFTPNVVVEKVGDYYTAVVRPRAFDPNKKYPVIVDVYGGPTHIHVQRAIKNWLIPQWVADQGFVVVAIDNRGTPGRGREWERAIYQKFGTVPLEDQVKGLHLLCDKHPELDRDRVGIVGWSFGGYMAANAVLRRPDVYKAAVAGAPVTDWEDYDTHYTERYLGLLPESRKAYDEASLLPLAKNLSRPLLLVHGTADDNVYYRHTLKLSDALFRAGKPFEVLPLPGVTHMYTADPEVTERLWARTVGFFKLHLGEPR